MTMTSKITSLDEERIRRAKQEPAQAREAEAPAAPPPFSWARFRDDFDRRVFQCLEVAPGFSPAQHEMLRNEMLALAADATAEITARLDALERRLAERLR
jgi:hypothetical protein